MRGWGESESSEECHEQRKVFGFSMFSGLGRSFTPCGSVWDSCGDLDENGPIGSYREALLGDVVLLEKCVMEWDLRFSKAQAQYRSLSCCPLIQM